MDAPPPFPAQDQVLLMPLEEIITKSTTKKAAANRTPPEERKLVRAEKDKAIKCPCPRCNSTNTKFCYYNNYSLSQPRYLCKACKRYWTQGGSLRSIPVGGRTRKNKLRPSSSSSSSTTAASKIKLPDLVESSNNLTIPTNPNPKFTHQYHPQDLNLGFTPNLQQWPTMEAHFINQPISASNSYISAVELLTGSASSRGVMAPFMPMQASYPNSVHPIGFSLDGIGSGGYGGRRILFPFEDLRSTATAATTVTATADSINAANVNDHHQEHRRDHDQHGDLTGYWTGNIF